MSFEGSASHPIIFGRSYFGRLEIMDVLHYLRNQFAYNAWANHEVWRLLSPTEPSSGKSLSLFAHILSAERLWLERIKNQAQSLPVWPDLSLESCNAHMVEVASLWQEYLDRLFVAQLSSTVRYRNSKGEEWNNAIQDILTHVLFHSAYHRGQIALQLRGSGEQPAYTDYIHAIRNGLLE